MQVIFHYHSFPYVNTLIPLHSDTNTLLPHCKIILSPTELKTPLPGRSSFHAVCSSPGSGSLCPPSTPWGLFSFLLGCSILPAKQAPFLPSSSYLGFESTPLCMESSSLCSGSSSLCQPYFTQMLSTSCKGSNILHWAALLHWMSSCMGPSLTMPKLPHPMAGHSFVEMSLPGLLYPVPDHLSLWTLLTLHLYWALLQWECLPLSSWALTTCTGLPSSVTLLVF